MTNGGGELEGLEIRLLLEGVFDRYGYDFRDYAPASLRRRLLHAVREEGLATVTALLDRVLHDPEAMQRLVSTISVDVSGMFRDPRFYLALRRHVVPLLRAQSFVRVWHAGCASGEEVYSLAIVLQEEGLSDRVRVYATDLSEAALERARQGIVPLRALQGYTDSYIRAGGTRDFSEYYTARYDSAILRASLRKHVLWAQHNLVSDASFNEFQLVLCRNVMIYFNQTLQARVHRLIHESLAVGGVLGLGARESLAFTTAGGHYQPLDAGERLFRKVRP